MSSRDKILARRAKFMAAALVSAGMVGCGSEVEPAPTDAAVDAPKDTATDTGAQPCLTADADYDTGPMPCLDPIEDTGPEPCLEPPYDTGPEPCLAPPPEDAG